MSPPFVLVSVRFKKEPYKLAKAQLPGASTARAATSEYWETILELQQIEPKQAISRILADARFVRLRRTFKKMIVMMEIGSVMFCDMDPHEQFSKFSFQRIHIGRLSQWVLGVLGRPKIRFYWMRTHRKASSYLIRWVRFLKVFRDMSV